MRLKQIDLEVDKANKHTTKYSDTYPDTVHALQEDTYLDDVQGSGNTLDVVQRLKGETTKMLNE